MTSKKSKCNDNNNCNDNSNSNDNGNDKYRDSSPSASLRVRMTVLLMPVPI